MEPLLKVLGKRVHDLRVEKGWSQEEFAHVCGLHRTYVGQIERGEKNVSFENLTKFSGALSLTLSELMLGLETGTPAGQSGGVRYTRDSDRGAKRPETRIFEMQKLVRRLNDQRAAMDRTISMLTEWAAGDNAQTSASPRKPSNARIRSVPKAR